MARLARVVMVIRTMSPSAATAARTFFGDHDYALYRDLLAENCRASEVDVWAWCLMPNHVHLILVPSDPTGCAARSRGCIATMPESSRRGANAAVISGRAGSARSP
jgi:hypothetical protein